MPSVATRVYLTLNKTALGVIAGATAAGYYSNSDNLIQIVISIVTATGTVILPRAASEFAKGNENEIKRMLYVSFDFVSCLSIPMAFGVAAIALKLSTFFYGKGFAPVGPVMMIESFIIVLVAWSNAIGIQYLLPIHRTKDYTKSLIVSAIFSIVVNIPLIMTWGLHGAMITTVLCEGLVTIYQLFTVRKELSVFKLFEDVPKFLFAGIIMFILVFLINSNWNFNFITMVIEVFVGVVTYGVILVLLRPKILFTAKKLLIERKK